MSDEVIGQVRTSELVLYYQPQMSADGLAIVSAEALVRHLHPVRGLLSPAELFKSLNTVPLREKLDWWVLAEACRQARLWPSLPISVNVTASQLRKRTFGARALAVIDSHGVPRENIEIEILEAVFIKDFDAAVDNINLLRDNGVKVALDDFGTGYSSLAYLLRMPIDKLKIDKTFVDMIGSVQATSIIHSLVALARALGLKITAEGVETSEQHRFLRAVGCHYMQGYFFSRPVPAAMLTRMLNDQIAAKDSEMDALRQSGAAKARA